MSEEEFDTSFQDEPVCPYCGHQESAELTSEIGQDETDCFCTKCEKKYSIDQEFSRTFCSSRTCQPKDEHQWQDWNAFGTMEIRYCKICSFREMRKT